MSASRLALFCTFVRNLALAAVQNLRFCGADSL